MVKHIPIGVGAGLASALLAAVVTQGSALALLLYLLAPIPILVAALGWDHRAGLVGSVVGGLALALALSPVSGLGFALGSALPAWWLAYLALLGRPAPDGSIEWYPLGRLLAWTAATSAITYLAAAAVPDLDYAAYERRAREAAETLLRVQTGAPEGAPIPNFGETPAADVAASFAAIAPLFAAQGFTVILIVYLWLGARIVQVSGRLARPWRPLHDAVMPPAAILALAGSAIAAGVLPGFLGVFALALAGALLMAFGLQGLGGVHALSEGRPGRAFLLIGVYLLVVFSQGLVLLALAFVGIADSAFGLRARILARRPPSIVKRPPKE